MTRRMIVFREGDTYYVSQDFNGDREEAEHGAETGSSIKPDWFEIPPMFDGVETLESFKCVVQAVEALYRYDAMPVVARSELPKSDEAWLMSHGTLILAARYGKSMVECLAKVAQEYGFKTKCDSESIQIRAKDTDGHWCNWFTIIPDSKGTCKIIGNNTDQADIWLHETRPDLTPERCVEFFETISRTLGLYGDNRILPTEWIDPEDWQCIACIHDAYSDERYTKGKL